jgi:hypothetical protein
MTRYLWHCPAGAIWTRRPTSVAFWNLCPAGIFLAFATPAWVPAHRRTTHPRQMRMVARGALMYKHTVGPLLAGLGKRDCHTAQRL